MRTPRRTRTPLIVAATVALVAGLGIVALGRGARPAQGGAQLPTPDLSAGQRAAVDRELDRLTPTGKAEPRVGGTSLTAYQAAAGRYTACIRTTLGKDAATKALVVQASAPQLSTDRFQLDIDVSLASGGLDAGQSVGAQAALDSAQGACFQSSLAAVELAYQAGLLADPGYVASSSAGFLACVGDGGVSTAGVTNPRSLLTTIDSLSPADQDVVTSCADGYPSISSVPEPLAGG